MVGRLAHEASTLSYLLSGCLIPFLMFKKTYKDYAALAIRCAISKSCQLTIGTTMQVIVTKFRQFLYRWLCGLILISAANAAFAQSLSKMALLLPDGLAVTDAQVTAWTDAAQERGYKLDILRNAAFQLAGPGIKSQYSGIIVPDQMQVSMSDALVTSIQNYVIQGGNIMLVYDAGALTDTGFYAIPKSRFSTLVGVDYVLYDSLRERTVGLGPTIGGVSLLRAMQVPPGKSMLYTPPTGAALAGYTPLGMARAIRVASPNKGTQAGSTAEYLPASPSNPGGLAGHDHSLNFKPPTTIPSTTPGAPKQPGKGLKREGEKLHHPDAVERERVPNVTPGHSGASLRSSLRTSGTGSFGRTGPKTLAALAPAPAGDPIHSISGYVYGALTYPSFVTQGTALGTVLFSSPQHGLVASSRSVGSGSVLFVNLPLTYLKLSEDAMPLHGFLHLFARGELKQPRLTDVPNGTGGLVFNWHLDSNGALGPMQTLKNMGVWNNKPFSMHITAGPDTVTFGDRIGFDLPNNPVAQQFLRDFDVQGHQVANHGGWIHDYFGINMNETNQAEFQPYLVLNDNAVKNVIGHRTTEYSAPQGNNPLWALTWLEQNGIGSYYSLSHTGTAATRTYRQGQLRNPSLWAIPVMPFGVAATFEEFDELGIPPATLDEWYSQLIDFAVNGQTNRMIYAHPPGAVIYPTVINNLMAYARQKQAAGSFRWYTMTQLAKFMSKRAQANWSSTVSTTGRMRVTASHPTSLNTLAWAYPKTFYARPVPVSGTMTIVDQGSDWLVRTTGTTAVFEAGLL